MATAQAHAAQQLFDVEEHGKSLPEAPLKAPDQRRDRIGPGRRR
jgi:hypothetical protein